MDHAFFQLIFGIYGIPTQAGIRHSCLRFNRLHRRRESSTFASKNFVRDQGRSFTLHRSRDDIEGRKQHTR